MIRWDFVALLSRAAIGWPLAARAQPADPMRRIGVLGMVPRVAYLTNPKEPCSPAYRREVQAAARALRLMPAVELGVRAT